MVRSRVRFRRELSSVRANSALLVVVTCLSALLFSVSLRPGFNLIYRVTLDPTDSTAISVHLSLTGVSGDSLVLRAYAPSEILRLDQLRAFGPGGRGLRIGIRAEPVQARGRTSVLPRYIVRGPLPTDPGVSY